MTSRPVLLFARYAECFGAEMVRVEVPAEATVADVVNALRLLPGGEVLPSQPFVAVNQAHAGFGDPVHPGDEIALLPPLAGG